MPTGPQTALLNLASSRVEEVKRVKKAARRRDGKESTVCQLRVRLDTT